MSHLNMDKDIESFAKREQASKYKARFRELYQDYRIQHPTATHEHTVDYVYDVMADSQSINFNWIE